MGGVALSMQKVVRGGLWLYLDTILTYSIGYIYWLIISRIAGASVVGYAGTTTSLALLLQTIVLLGIPMGLQRFIGKSLGEGNYADLKGYFISSLSFCFIILASTCLLFYFLQQPLHKITGLDAVYIFLAIFLLLFSGLNMALRSFLISIVYVNNIFIADLIANSIRLLTGVLLVLEGWGGVGATAGFVFSASTNTVLLSLYSIRALKEFGEARAKISYRFVNDTLKAGFANWLPGVVTVVGIQFAILAVFGFRGASEAGIYYVAYAITSIVLALPMSLLGLLFPVLSGMSDGRKRATSNIIRISLDISVPIAIAVIVYSKFVLNLLGEEFVAGWLILSVLCLSVPLACVVQGVTSLTYATGLYRIVLAIGLAMSVTRVALYFLLVPVWGGVGAAISFFAGFLISFLVTILIAYRIKFAIMWEVFIITIMVPIIVGLPVYFFNLPYYLGIPLILLGSSIIYARLRVITRDDLGIIATAVLPQEVIKQITLKIDPILKILFGE